MAPAEPRPRRRLRKNLSLLRVGVLVMGAADIFRARLGARVPAAAGVGLLVACVVCVVVGVAECVWAGGGGPTRPSGWRARLHCRKRTPGAAATTTRPTATSEAGTAAAAGRMQAMLAATVRPMVGASRPAWPTQKEEDLTGRPGSRWRGERRRRAGGTPATSIRARQDWHDRRRSSTESSLEWAPAEGRRRRGAGWSATSPRKRADTEGGHRGMQVEQARSE